MQISQINSAIDKRNKKCSQNPYKQLRDSNLAVLMNETYYRERVLDFFGIIIAAGIHGRFGSIWDNIKPEGQQEKVNHSNWMKQYQFQQICDMVSSMCALPEEKQNDDWWMISCCIGNFNQK